MTAARVLIFAGPGFLAGAAAAIGWRLVLAVAIVWLIAGALTAAGFGLLCTADLDERGVRR